MKSWVRDCQTKGTDTCLTAFSRDGAFCTNCYLGATTKNLNEKASLYEGDGFSRAVNGLYLTAAEVRFCETHRFAVFLEVLTHPLRALTGPHAV
jgi:hypothetical protein